REWFDENYLLLYGHRNDEDASSQIELIKKNIPPEGLGPVLDLCCGNGRHLCALNKAGYDVYGLDLSMPLLREAVKKGFGSRIFCADMRAIPGKFSAVFSLFTSFGYFNTDSQNMDALYSVRDSLETGGVFWLDFLNPKLVASNLREKEVIQLADGRTVDVERKISDGRVIKNIYFDPETRYTESVRMYSLKELRKMIKKASFNDFAVFGDYSGTPYTENSERIIIAAGKK
ncbi:MAG: class I SAM-dependent DNA methyltransferase, partial [Fibrobacterota bacterium]